MGYREKFGRFHLSCHQAQVAYLLRYPQGWRRPGRRGVIAKLGYDPYTRTFWSMLKMGPDSWTTERNIWGEWVVFYVPEDAAAHCMYVNAHGFPK